MPDRRSMDDLLHALRTCWPKKSAVRMFRGEFGEHLERSFQSLRKLLGEDRLEGKTDREQETVDKLVPEVAVSLALGFLTERAKEDRRPAEDETDGFARLVNSAAQHDGLRDVMLTVRCARGDETSNRVLLEIIGRDVRRFLVAKWGVGKAKPVIDDLPSHLLEPQKQGLNRGRIRLLTFCGGSSLPTWLKVVAAHLIQDRVKRDKEVQPVENGEHPTFDDGLDSPPAVGDKVSPEDELLRNLLAEAATPVFKQLLRRLRQESIQQYYYGILRCVRGYSPAQIAVRLRVTRPRVTQLSQTFCSKFLSVLAGEEPEFGDVADTVGKLDLRTRHALEEAIRDLLQADKEVDGPVDKEGE